MSHKCTLFQLHWTFPQVSRVSNARGIWGPKIRESGGRYDDVLQHIKVAKSSFQESKHKGTTPELESGEEPDSQETLITSGHHSKLGK